MVLNLKSGSIGQIQGPFSENDVFTFRGLNDGIVYVKLGIIINDKDLMTFGDSEDKGFTVRINGDLIRFGWEGIYELDEVMKIDSLSFPQGAPASVIIDYVVMNT